MKSVQYLLILFCCLPLLLTGCFDKCDDTTPANVKGLYFTVEYQTPGGQNYLNSIYNQSNVQVFLDSTGGENTFFEPIFPGYADGKFGPFYFTDRFINKRTDEPEYLQLYAKPYRFDYYIKKDTFGQDKFTVEFLLGVDKCQSFWQILNYYRNDKLIEGFDLNETANIIIVE